MVLALNYAMLPRDSKKKASPFYGANKKDINNNNKKRLTKVHKTYTRMPNGKEMRQKNAKSFPPII